MNMNKFISSLLFLCLFSITDIRAERDSTFTPFPQEYPNDTLPQIQKIPSREERRWLPDNLIFQYAGSIGICSAGIGWEYGKRHWETDLLLGIVPKAYGRPAMLSTTIKQVYTPWRIPFAKNFSIQPLHCGLFINSIINENFWTKEPQKYPNGYYGFSTKIRFHISFGQSISWKIPDKIRFGKELSCYYELNTCDLYLISAFTNRYLSPKDYLSLALGAKWCF